MKYFKDLDGALFVDPILGNHGELIEIDLVEFNQLASVKSIPDSTASAKAERVAALQSMVFTGSSGIAIQCRPQDKQVMLDAIDFMNRQGLSELDWYAVDNTWTVVTIADLESAIISGQDQGAAIWATFKAA